MQEGHNTKFLKYGSKIIGRTVMNSVDPYIKLILFDVIGAMASNNMNLTCPAYVLDRKLVTLSGKKYYVLFLAATKQL